MKINNILCNRVSFSSNYKEPSPRISNKLCLHRPDFLISPSRSYQLKDPQDILEIPVPRKKKSIIFFFHHYHQFASLLQNDSGFLFAITSSQKRFHIITSSQKNDFILSLLHLKTISNNLKTISLHPQFISKWFTSSSLHLKKGFHFITITPKPQLFPSPEAASLAYNP